MDFLQQIPALKQTLHLSTEMQQALHVLQLPVLELAEWLQLEIERNPLLEFDVTSSSESLESLLESVDAPSFEESETPMLLLEKQKKSYQEGLLTYPPSLYDYLKEQALWTFNDPSDLAIAEQLIGSLDSHGFLPATLTDLVPDVPIRKLKQIVRILQTFEPIGVCAKNLQESLLIQLQAIGKSQSISFAIVQDHFDDLLANRLQLIARKQRLSLQTLHQLIQKDLSHLNFHPSNAFYHTQPQGIIPDLYLELEEEKWKIHVNHSPLPQFHMNPTYQNISLALEEKKYVETYLKNGQWLQTIINRRQEILLAIARCLIDSQSSFLSGEQQTLLPMTYKDLAAALDLHESTIARAVSHKYLQCPHGIFSLRTFFTQGIQSADGKSISSQTIQQLLIRLIAKEDKQHPFSDEKLAQEFEKMGIPCARRTIAKYRKKLHIAASSKRRRY